MKQTLLVWRSVGQGMRGSLSAIGLTVLLMVGLAGNALAQADTRALLDRLERVERQLGTLEQSVYRGQPPAAPAAARPSSTGTPSLAPSTAADVQIRMTELEDELGSLTGRIEELGHRVNQINTRLDKLVADLDTRFQQLDGKLSPAGAKPEGGQQQAALPTGSPQQLYNHAISILMRADKDQAYSEAERALATFIAAYPSDPNQSNARFFLGETHYVRRDYAQAAVAYAEGYRAYPNGSKAADSLLKLGMSLGQLGKTGEACQSFAELQTKFKNPGASIQQSLTRERQRYKCR